MSEDGGRDSSIDLVRGAVMVLMALDHARDFFVSWRPDPTNLAETTPALFFTRWVTHVCAPGFLLLAGIGAYLYGCKRGASARRRFLWTRGLWLLVLELTVVRLAWAWPMPWVPLQVIWAIGWAMILLAPLSALPARWLVALGATIIVGHDALEPLDGALLDRLGFLWAVLHEPTSFEGVAGHHVFVRYPLLPWLGVMALGMGLGELFTRDRATRQGWLWRLGLGACVAFVVVRLVGVYGDPSAVRVHDSLTGTVMSVLNCEKYPPSLAFTLMTLGPVLLALYALSRWSLPRAIHRPLETFGRVPLLYYVAHLYLLHAAARLCALWRWGPASLDHGPGDHIATPLWPLYSAYLATAAVVVVLYPVCRRYAELKRRKGHQWWWLGYL